jgi:hypothetical protein
MFQGRRVSAPCRPAITVPAYPLQYVHGFAPLPFSETILERIFGLPFPVTFISVPESPNPIARDLRFR